MFLFLKNCLAELEETKYKEIVLKLSTFSNKKIYTTIMTLKFNWTELFSGFLIKYIAFKLKKINVDLVALSAIAIAFATRRSACSTAATASAISLEWVSPIPKISVNTGQTRENSDRPVRHLVSTIGWQTSKINFIYFLLEEV